MTTDGRVNSQPAPESREPSKQPPMAPPLYSDALVAEEVEEARKNEADRKGTKSKAEELVAEQTAELQDSVT
jgi:hypothetical protein